MRNKRRSDANWPELPITILAGFLLGEEADVLADEARKQHSKAVLEADSSGEVKKPMQRIGPGRYQVSLDETITIDIKKSVGQWLVSVSNLDNATWSPEPDDGIDGSFQVPGTVGETASFTALYNFTPGGDSAGDFYTVTFTGSKGGSSTTFVDAPALQDRTYSFEVQ